MNLNQIHCLFNCIHSDSVYESSLFKQFSLCDLCIHTYATTVTMQTPLIPILNQIRLSLFSLDLYIMLSANEKTKFVFAVKSGD